MGSVAGKEFSKGEKEERYPNASYTVSHNLLTPAITPDRDTLVQRNRQALQTIERWLADPRLARVQRQLVKIGQRLEVYAQQAGTAPAAPAGTGRALAD